MLPVESGYDGGTGWEDLDDETEGGSKEVEETVEHQAPGARVAGEGGRVITPRGKLLCRMLKEGNVAKKGGVAGSDDEEDESSESSKSSESSESSALRLCFHWFSYGFRRVFLGI